MFSSWWKDRGEGQSAGSGFSMSDDPVESPSGAVLGAGCFRLYGGSRNNKKQAVSVFRCGNPSDFDAAREGLKRLKTLRHPSVVTFLDAADHPTKGISVATELVVPLLDHLSGLEDMGERTGEYRAWGVMQLFRGVGFLHEIGLVHGCVHSGSVFVTPGLEWKLFGFEVARQKGGRSPAAGTHPPSSLSKYAPPEQPPTDDDAAAGDVWGCGTVVWEVFNGPLQSKSQLGKLGKIPAKLGQAYVELVAKNPSKRPSLKEKLEEMKRPGGCFKNDLIEAMSFLEEFQIKDEAEKARFFSSLSQKLEKFPPQLCVNKILPDLVQMFDYSNAGAQILAPVFKIGKHLSTEEYQEKIVPCLVKLFASSDRNARYKLLCQLESFVEHLSSKIVNDQVFPQIVNGFVDQQPVIREKTVIAVIHLSSKLTFANLDETVVMKHFSRLLRDEQPGIRTNTTVCLGKVSRHLHYQTRQKVLASAFGAKLKDPFPPARIAAVNALAATQQYYTVQETSSRILPMLCALLTDDEKPVREQAFKVTRGFLQKLEQVSEDPDLKEEMEAMVSKNQEASSAATVSSWASWAVGAIGAKFYKSSMKPAAENNPEKEKPEQTKPLNSGAMKLMPREEEDNDEEEEENGWDNAADDDDEEGACWESLDSDVNKPTAFGSNDDRGKEEPSSGWDDWNNDDASSAAKKASEEEERRRLREEKRIARQKEIEAKRAARKAGGGGGGAMKLGSKLS